MIYTSFPRTVSWISHLLSPTENLDRMRLQAGMPSMLQTLLTSSGWELPPRTTRLRTISSVGCDLGRSGDDVEARGSKIPNDDDDGLGSTVSRMYSYASQATR